MATAACGTQATYVAAVLAVATARGVTDAEQIARVTQDAIDFWQSRLNTYSGHPVGDGSDQGR